MTFTELSESWKEAQRDHGFLKECLNCKMLNGCFETIVCQMTHDDPEAHDNLDTEVCLK